MAPSPQSSPPRPALDAGVVGLTLEVCTLPTTELALQIAALVEHPELIEPGAIAWLRLCIGAGELARRVLLDREDT